MKELITIQSELKAPKSQYNSFGKYKYRSLEDINEAVKPLLKTNKCTLVMSDEMQVLGDRYYVKATATLTNSTGDVVTSCGWARESLTKKGMDDSQITGTASSYARKYALNGLFCLDDTKDADTDEYHKTESRGAEQAKERDLLRSQIIAEGREKGYSPSEIAAKYDIDGSTGVARMRKVLDEMKELEARDDK